MTRAGEKPPANRRRTLAQILYTLRVLVLLAALGVVIRVYNGDAYVALMLVICAVGAFVAGIAPGLVPGAVRLMITLPFALGALIPLWGALEAGVHGDPDLALHWLGVAVAYTVAVLLLTRLPARMRGPFLPWLPEGALQQPARHAPTREVHSSGAGSYSASAGYGRESSSRATDYGREPAHSAAYSPGSSRQSKPAESEKKGGLFGRREKTAPEPKAAPRPATPYGREATPVESEKKGGLFGRREKTAPEPKAPPRPATPYGREATPVESEKKGGLFGRRGKATPEPKAPPRPATPYGREATPVESEKKGGLFGRRGKATPEPKAAPQSTPPHKRDVTGPFTAPPERVTGPFYSYATPDEDTEEAGIGAFSFDAENEDEALLRMYGYGKKVSRSELFSEDEEALLRRSIDEDALSEKDRATRELVERIRARWKDQSSPR
ncbi:MAG: hypothetical protein HPY64_16510 [Anaerolineae bacterium]|nr:hypothetical protein [Anaerolineae bacterium]